MFRDPKLSAVWFLALSSLACQSAAPRTFPASTDPSSDDFRAWRERSIESPGGTSRAPDLVGRSFDLDALIALADRRDPSVAAAFERWRAAVAGIALAEKPPEPKLTLATYLAEVETRVGPMEGRIGLRQAWPWFGSLELRGDVAVATAEALQREFEDARLASALGVQELWYDLVDLGATLEITRANLELMRHWEGLSRSRFEANLASNSDLLRAQVEAARLEDQVVSLEGRYPTLWARLAERVGIDAALLRETRPGVEALPGAPTYSREVLQARLRQESPRMQAADARTRAADHARELADKAFYPRLTLGVDHTFIGDASSGVTGSGDDALALSVTLDVPIWRRAYRGGQAQGDARARAARLNREAIGREEEATLETLLFELEDCARKEELYVTNLIPRTEQSLSSLDSGYQTGDVSYLDLLDVERTLFNDRLELARTRIDRARANARIERLLGPSPLQPSQTQLEKAELPR